MRPVLVFSTPALPIAESFTERAYATAGMSQKKNRKETPDGDARRSME
jgi:hypothetical protein